jgi:hypothetical protein
LDEFYWDSDAGRIVFVSKIGGMRTRHWIEREALDDFFDAESAGHVDINQLAAFRNRRDEIQVLAIRAVESGQINGEGGANITTTWLSEIKFQRTTAKRSDP